MDIGFHGVRGSTPCACSANQGYGGNTSCVVLEQPGHEPVVLDLGTGLRSFGDEWIERGRGPFEGHALVTHLHWDHVQGLPFFAPLLCEGSRLDIWGPAPEGAPLRDAFSVFMAPPYFPITLDDLAADIEFHDLAPGTVMVGGAEVRAGAVPHRGTTFGYRVRMGDGPVVAYVPDHQQPLNGSMDVDPGVVELCRGADVLIHDAQFTPAEFAGKSDWGHCTVEYALRVAAASEVGRLVLFHHDPGHDDDTLDAMLEEAVRHPLATSITEVLAAREGMTLHCVATPR